jgi:LacI family transcriptional regulator
MINSGQRHRITTITPDNAQGGFLAAEFFHKKGHENLGIITCLPDNSDMIERKNGFIKYLKQNKLKVNKNWFLNCNPGIDGGFSAASMLLKERNHPSAVFCVTDETALGVLCAMRELKLKCPDDMAVIGFDNLAVTQYLSPPLTTIEQPIAEVTQAAVDILMKIIKTNSSPTHTVFPVKLIERRSV